MCCALAIFFLLEARAGVFLAKGTTTLCIETLSLQIGLADLYMVEVVFYCNKVNVFGIPVSDCLFPKCHDSLKDNMDR